MYLSDRDLVWALKNGQLLVDPYPKDQQIGPTSIDLHLDRIEEAKVWNIAKYKEDNSVRGLGEADLNVGTFEYKKFASVYLMEPREEKDAPGDPVVRRGNVIVVKPHGFVLWQTKEKVGTPEEGAQLICFIDGKSTRARTGILVHMTAPTIHAA
jgi:dCTP deaminase